MNSPPLLHPWPDLLDLGILSAAAGLVLSLTIAGYVFMVIDFRAYLRSLRRQLVRVLYRVETPDWVLRETPPCLSAFGLRLPCSEEQLLRSYRKKIKWRHPDRGGDQREFMHIQSQFEESLRFLRRRAASESKRSSQQAA